MSQAKNFSIIKIIIVFALSCLPVIASNLIPLSEPLPVCLSDGEQAKIKTNIKELACKLTYLYNFTNIVKITNHSNTSEFNIEVSLDKICEGTDPLAFFPTAGTTSAGKSTFLAWLMGLKDRLLPESNAAATSIPTRIYHGLIKEYTLPQCDKWVSAISAYTNRLIVNSLNVVVTKDSGDDQLYLIQEKIRAGNMSLLCNVENDTKVIAQQLWSISHFTRLVWKNNLDLETDFGISLDFEQLPRLDVPMPTFKEFPPGTFAFLDTPGINEAKTSEILHKLTPKFIRHASGTILCVPPDQVDHKAVEDLFRFANKYMKGKIVVIVLIIKGGTTKSEIEELKMKLLKYLVPSIRKKVIFMVSKTIHLRAMFRLRDYLAPLNANTIDLDFMQNQTWWADMQYAYPQKASIDSHALLSWPNLFANGDKQKVYKDMVNLQTVEIKDMNGDEMLDTFKNIYKQAKLLAHEANIAVIEDGFDLWKSILDGLKEIVEASDAEREKIQLALVEQKKKWEAIHFELDRFPTEMRNGISDLVNAFKDTMFKFAATQSGWHIVSIQPNGTEEVLKEHIFYEGLGQFKQWCREKVKTKLEGIVKEKSQSELTVLKSKIIPFVKTFWVQLTELVDILPNIINDDLQTDNSMTHHLAPEFKLDVVSSAKTFADIDPSNCILYEEVGDEIVVQNSNVGPATLKEFNKAVEKGISMIQDEFQFQVEEYLGFFQKRADFELEKATLRYKQNEEYLNNQIQEQNIGKLVDEAIVLGNDFHEKLEYVKNTLKECVKNTKK